MRLFRRLLPWALGAGLASSPGISRAEDVTIPFTTTTLPNGLVVILHEDHTLPIVVVERHLQGRLALRGAQPHRLRAPLRAPDVHGHDARADQDVRRVDGGGGRLEQRLDERGSHRLLRRRRRRTRSRSSSGSRPTACAILGPLMTQEKLDAQRDVVRNERRQTSENQPYGKVELRLPELLYPEAHPYHHPVIGSHEDLEAATVDDVKAFFATLVRSRRTPRSSSPATSTPQGDDRQDRQRLFGWILPSRGSPKEPGDRADGDVRPTLQRRRPRDHRRTTSSCRRSSWPGSRPTHFAPGRRRARSARGRPRRPARRAGSTRRSSTIRSSRRTSTRRRSRGSSARASSSRRIARPGVSLDKLEAAIDKELAKACTDAVTDEELTRAKNTIRDGLRRAGSRACTSAPSLLNMYQAELGDPGFAQRDLDRYRTATSADLLKVTARRPRPERPRHPARRAERRRGK